MTAVSTELESTLHQLSETLTLLVNQLRREHDLFVQSEVDTEALNALAHDKQHALTRIEQLEQVRHQLLIRLGVRPDDMDACTRTCNALACGSLWQEVCTLARQVKQMNGTSARVAEERYRVNRELLASMRAQRSNQLYGANGQAMKGRARRVMMAG